MLLWQVRERRRKQKRDFDWRAQNQQHEAVDAVCVCVWMRRKDVSSLLRDEDCRRRTLRNWLSGVSSPLERSLPSLRDPIQRHLDRIRLPLFVFPLLLLILPSLTIPLPLHSPFYHCPRCVVDVGVDLEPTPLLLLLYLSIRSY